MTASARTTHTVGFSRSMLGRQGQLPQSSGDRRTRQAGGKRHRRHATPTQVVCLGRSPLAPTTLVHLRVQRPVLEADAHDLRCLANTTMIGLSRRSADYIRSIYCCASPKNAGCLKCAARRFRDDRPPCVAQSEGSFSYLVECMTTPCVDGSLRSWRRRWE